MAGGMTYFTWRNIFYLTKRIAFMTEYTWYQELIWEPNILRERNCFSKHSLPVRSLLNERNCVCNNYTWWNELLLSRNTFGVRNWFDNRIYFMNGIAFQSTASPWEVYLMKRIADATSILREQNCFSNHCLSDHTPSHNHPSTNTPSHSHPCRFWNIFYLTKRNAFMTEYTWYQELIWDGIAFQSTASPWEVYLMKGIAYATIILDETNCCCHGIHLVSGIDSITEYTSWTELLFKAPPPHEKST